ncbi:uracil-DNA glycosylase family protein [Pyruvatibacter sp. HU-CL02332]|uniref:uracil-DNA glycosylase family protein n=1 Tax=Pyruvatibacter sp. HU-CL02332 TaxID=3127650 RepID=UPI00310654AF
MADEAAVQKLLKDIRACTECADDLPHDPRPVLRASTSARVCIVGQAPGTRVHASGVPFDDPSGDRLREWLGVDRDTFYDESRIAIVPMGFCFPGLDAKGGDKPPLKRCAKLWRTQLFETLGEVDFTVIIGTYAQAWHLGKARKKTVTETVAAWRDYMPSAITLPHPSWRNNTWLKKNPWFEADVLPVLRAEVAKRV